MRNPPRLWGPVKLIPLGGGGGGAASAPARSLWFCQLTRRHRVSRSQRKLENTNLKKMKTFWKKTASPGATPNSGNKEPDVGWSNNREGGGWGGTHWGPRRPQRGSRWRR